MDPGKCHILGFLKLVRYQVSLTNRLTVNIAKFQKFLESENIVISSENKIVNYVNEKTFWLVLCRQVSPKPDAGWKMSVAMKFIQDAKHGQFKVLNTNQQNSFSARRN